MKGETTPARLLSPAPARLTEDEFARAFYDADVLVITDVFPAREKPIEGVTGELIAEKARAYGHRNVHYVADKHDLPLSLRMPREGPAVALLVATGVARRGRLTVEVLFVERAAIASAWVMFWSSLDPTL